MSGNLTAQQRRMADHLRDPQGKAPPEGIEERRLQVYRDLVYRNIKGFIDSTFPVLCSLHSEAEWEALVREFIREYRCHSPLFLEISEEFIGFLASREQDPTRPWMLELAHYEWLELAVDVADAEVPAAPGETDLNVVVARLAPTARVASYQFAVHRIGPSFRPTDADDPVSLLVYRNREDRVKFMELSPAAARLLHEAATTGESARALLERLAAEWGMDVESTVAFGSDQLREFAGLGAIAFEPLGVE